MIYLIYLICQMYETWSYSIFKHFVPENGGTVSKGLNRILGGGCGWHVEKRHDRIFTKLEQNRAFPVPFRKKSSRYKNLGQLICFCSEPGTREQHLLIESHFFCST